MKNISSFSFEFKVRRVSLHLSWFWKIFEICLFSKIYLAKFSELAKFSLWKLVHTKVFKILIPENQFMKNLKTLQVVVLAEIFPYSVNNKDRPYSPALRPLFIKLGHSWVPLLLINADFFSTNMAVIKKKIYHAKDLHYF